MWACDSEQTFLACCCGCKSHHVGAKRPGLRYACLYQVQLPLTLPKFAHTHAFALPCPPLRASMLRLAVLRTHSYICRGFQGPYIFQLPTYVTPALCYVLRASTVFGIAPVTYEMASVTLRWNSLWQRPGLTRVITGLVRVCLTGSERTGSLVLWKESTCNAITRRNTYRACLLPTLRVH